MKILHALAALITVALFQSGAIAQSEFDTVRVSGTLVSGTVKSISSTEVVVTQSNGDRRLPANDIEWVRFVGEPRELNQIRTLISRSQWQEAADLLAKLELPSGVRSEVRQDVEYLQGLTRAKLALTGIGDLSEAGKLVFAFVNNRNNRESYRFLPASELLGDLLAATGNYELATRSYTEVANAPWPDYQMRGNLALGRMLLAQGKYDEAQQKFAAIRDINATAQGVASLKLIATLGQAEAMANLQQLDQSLALVEQVIAQAPANEHEVYARAYNVQGLVYRKQEQPKQALLAYLHVPVLFSSSPDNHAEALAHLRTLWEELGQADRAKEAERELLEKYPNTRWAKQ